MAKFSNVSAFSQLNSAMSRCRGNFTNHKGKFFGCFHNWNSKLLCRLPIENKFNSYKSCRATDIQLFWKTWIKLKQPLGGDFITSRHSREAQMDGKNFKLQTKLAYFNIYNNQYVQCAFLLWSHLISVGAWNLEYFSKSIFAHLVSLVLRILFSNSFSFHKNLIEFYRLMIWYTCSVR